MTDVISNLSEKHRALLDASGISDEVAMARGYRTVEVKAELKRLGFRDYQLLVPALLIPIHSLDGTIANYQIRPDEARIKDGKSIKYESPGRSRMVLDVPPGVLKQLPDPAIPLYITEGARKADAAVSKGLCCIALLGVWGWRGTNDSGGKTALADWERIALNGRTIYIAFDSDVIQKTEVQRALRRLKLFLKSRGASVSVVRLPAGDGGQKVGLDDFLASGKSVDDLLALASPTEDLEESNSGDPHAIYAGQADLQETVTQAWEAVLNFNRPPKSFIYGTNQIVRLTDTGGEPSITPVMPDAMRLMLARASKWYLMDRERQAHDAKPPADIARAMLADDLCPLPVLNRLIRSPFMAPDGQIVVQEGYHLPTRVYYYPQGLKLLPVPMQPTESEIRRARELILDDLLVDFPFASEADRANAVALFLLPFVREVVDGPTPLHLIEKPSPGTGAGLLADVFAKVARGADCPVMTEGRDEDEWRKRITSALLPSPEIIMIDNLRNRLDSASLSGVLTARAWSDRKLGQSLTVSIPVRCVWIATANNPAVSSEISRRCVSIRMDAKVDRPWNRPPDTFKHPDLRLWTAQNRESLVAAALTLARAWVAAGRPRGTISLGSFEDWAAVLGGILQVAGINGFLQNSRRFYDQADREGEQMRSLLTAWWGKHGDRPVGVKELFDLVSNASFFELGTGNERSQKTRLGLEIAKYVDRQYILGDIHVRIEAADPHQHASRWRLVNVRDVGDHSGQVYGEEKSEGVTPVAESPATTTADPAPGDPKVTPIESDLALESTGKRPQGPQRSPNALPDPSPARPIDAEREEGQL